jgi:CubicO group peptidase (beta-lactamase class C family)
VALYSNAGAGLAALVVEYIARQPFEDYLHKHILQPLGINRKQASYRLSDFRERKSDLIEHYVFNSSWLPTLRSLFPRLHFTQVSLTTRC